MKVEDAIKKAIGGGFRRWDKNRKVVEVSADNGVFTYRTRAKYFREKPFSIKVSYSVPLTELFKGASFWKALGTKLRWRDEMVVVGERHYAVKSGWRMQWHRFIDHLADGKTAEEFFAEIN